jgi:hypothetical protein
MLLAGAGAQGLGEVRIDAHLDARRDTAVSEGGAAHADTLGLRQVIAPLRLLCERVDNLLG